MTSKGSESLSEEEALEAGEAGGEGGGEGRHRRSQVNGLQAAKVLAAKVLAAKVGAEEKWRHPGLDDLEQIKFKQKR